MTKPLKAGLMCVALVLSGLAGAETDAERQILQKPMPHQGLSGGKTVLVHWSQTRFSMYSKERNDATIREYQGYIRECLASSGDLQKLGFSIQPPKQWPDYLNAGREDRYVTSNYAIAYRYGWGYGFDSVHCGLIEVRRPPDFE
ncbi:hypothetical protein [Solimonas aquatica]|uniref:hypothetical protein n=1 Tax=Solimonas aquatica TaxID=489703 RepID=UPI0011603956|nr:hypothetical protein [Solimonas aquatica]